ncbi:Retrovirus-related Pol polyprotein from transposon gypsy-like Protein [Tribolium castaneum]|uniref:RNA-directed DNA polymerase n=1 Tax=Tribolium castaneum TaxID=7070 RepID=D6X3E7_TRICA|nr:Retrovirus-related Pol polyprotein from transposon gypsy-like Protein [Tribolium castaneum]
MDAIFGPQFEPNIFVYLDDIIITSKTFEEHILLLEEVHKRLEDANLTINLTKCKFFRKSLKYLGFIVEGNGLRADPDKVKDMINYPNPKTTTEIKRFQGMCSWYRRFIPHFSSLCAPLNNLIKNKDKGQKIIWTSEAQEAFLKIKNALVSAPILNSPNFSRPFIVQCDASDIGLGALLLQEIDGIEKIVAYASKTLSKAEKNYSVTEREALAVIFAVEKFRPFIEGTRFTIPTDHNSLTWLFRLKEPTGRLARWIARLSQFDFDLRHIKGKLNVVPDALSRIPTPDEIAVLDLNFDNLDKWYTNLRNKILKYPDKYVGWKITDGKIYKHLSSRLALNCNISEWKLVIPRKHRIQIIREYHDEPTASHFGFFKTFRRVSEEFYWPKMRPDILKYVRACKVCGSQKSPNQGPYGLMGQEKKVVFPWQMISVDLMGPFPRSKKGNSYLLAITDWLTKYVVLHPLRQATAAPIVRFIEDEIFLVYGVPQIIICDNGTQFAGKTMKALAKNYQVQKLWFTARYHPQANPVERTNRTIGKAIRSYIKENHRDWDINIAKIGYAIRTAVHEVTGHSPVFLNFGRKVPISGQFYGKVSAESADEIQTRGENETETAYSELVRLFATFKKE